jgi:transposase
VAYSAQFRKKLLSVKEEEGLTNEEAAKRFGVGKESVSRWKKNPDPLFKRNRPAQKIDMEALKKDVEEHPDDFIYERAARFSVSDSGMRYALKRLGVSRKKHSNIPRRMRGCAKNLKSKLRNTKLKAEPLLIWLKVALLTKVQALMAMQKSVSDVLVNWIGEPKVVRM